MQCAISGSNNIEKVKDRGSSSSLRRPLGRNGYNDPPKASEVTSLILGPPDRFFAIPVAPLGPLGHSNFGDLNLSFRNSLESYLVQDSAFGTRSIEDISTRDKFNKTTSEKKSVPSSSVLASNAIGHLQNKSLVNTQVKTDSLESFLVQDSVFATCSVGQAQNISTCNKPIKKHLKKKSKKKGTQRKKHLRDNHSTVLECLSKDSASGSCLSKTYVENGLSQEPGSISDVKCNDKDHICAVISSALLPQISCPSDVLGASKTSDVVVLCEEATNGSSLSEISVEYELSQLRESVSDIKLKDKDPNCAVDYSSSLSDSSRITNGLDPSEPSILETSSENAASRFFQMHGSVADIKDPICIVSHSSLLPQISCPKGELDLSEPSILEILSEEGTDGSCLSDKNFNDDLPQVDISDSDAMLNDDNQNCDVTLSLQLQVPCTKDGVDPSELSVLDILLEEDARQTSLSETYVKDGMSEMYGFISDVILNDEDQNSGINHSALISKVSCSNDSEVPSGPSVCKKDFGVKYKCGIQRLCETLSTFNGVDTHSKKSNFLDNSSEVLTDGHYTSTLESKCGLSKKKSSAKDHSASSLSEPSSLGNRSAQIQGPKKYLPHESHPKGVFNADKYAERTKFCSQASTSIQSHWNLSVKKFEHGHSGKENNGSLCWKKVQKNGGNEKICEQNEGNSGCSQSAVVSKESSPLDKSLHVDSNVYIKPKVASGSIVKVFEKKSRKANGELEQKRSSCSKKGSIAGKPNSYGDLQMNLLRMPELPPQVHQGKGFSTGSTNVEFCQSDKFGSHDAKPVQSSKVFQDQAKLLARYSIMNQAVDIEGPISALEPLNEARLFGTQSPEALDITMNMSSNLETEVPHTTLQRWTPVPKKDDAETGRSKNEKSLLSVLGQAVGDESNLKKINKYVTSDAQKFAATTANSVVIRASLSCRGVNLSTSKDESETHSTSELVTSMNKVRLSINDAYRVQLASEIFEQSTGGPLAEFEKLLQSAAPVLSQTNNLVRCKSCSYHQYVGSSLCRHNIPNISIRNLWQWYEKHGSYGLEIRAEDYQNSKRSSFHRSEFCAYFVPFLSAVQLFGHGSLTKLSKACDSGTASEGSNCVDHLPVIPVLLPSPCLPILSVLLPQPCEEDKVSYGQDNDSELLFEYFESEPPQQRRPLHEKIKELVGGDGSENHQAKKLNSLNLLDLHPDSWYSVAWYPIYKIPDGNFRAAFLTYHSVSHLVCVSSSSGGLSSIVSPVVGLQSYNTEGECWFDLKPQTAEIPNLNSCEILKDRLRTLEKTASDMARAVVRKDNQISVNRQPDYEFFLSRQRGL